MDRQPRSKAPHQPVAEQLGQAELLITVNDKEALRQLGKLKKELADFESQAGRSTGRATNTPKPKSGLGDFLRELREREQAETAADQRIARKREERRARESAKQAKAQRIAAAAQIGASPVEGSLRLVGSPRFSARGARQGGATESVQALERAQVRRFGLAQRIERLEERGANVSRLRASLGELTTAQSQRQFGTARQLSVELDRQLKLANARFRREQDTAALVARQARATSAAERAGISEGLRIGRLNAQPVTGATPTGPIPGSPAATKAAEQAEARLAAARERATRAAQKAAEAAAKQAAATEKATIAEGRRIGKLNASPVRGGAAFPGSPAFLDAQFPAFPKEFFSKQKQQQVKQQRAIEQGIKRRNDILSNAIIGGAFPALFGQGLGASVGGAAGGAAGGAIGGQFGFGLSLVGTALGAQFDAALNKAKELAKALDNPITQFSAIKENALLSSKGLEKNVEALIATGRQAEAAAIIQEDLSKTFGNTAGLKSYLEETDKLNRAWSTATVQLANFVSGPLADLINSLAKDVTRANIVNISKKQQAEFRRTASPQQQKELNTFIRRRSQEISQGGVSAAEDIELYKDVLAEIAKIQSKNNGALERAANNQKILVQSAGTLAKLEEAIGRARLGGNKPLEESLKLSKDLLGEFRKRKDLEQQLAAKRITAPEFSEQFKRSQQDERRLQQEFLDSSRESAVNAAQELQTTKQLAGLEGTRLEIAQRRIDLSKAFQAREQRGQELTRRYTDFFADPENQSKRTLFQGAQNAFTTAGIEFENKLRQASDYLRKAAKDAAQNLTSAIQTLGKLETDPGGLNRFLSRDEQFESNRRGILRFGQDAGGGASQLESAITKATELLGLTRAQANERFQGLRDIFAGAQQGRFASQEGFNTLSQFFDDVRTREQATTGLGDAQKTLTDVTSLNVSVQKELSEVVRTNTVALEALFGKDWSVNLAVQGGEVAAYGDVLNRNLTQ